MLPSYRTILVATDFSPNADHALQQAAALAQQADSKIYQLHVIAPIDSNVLHYITAMLGQRELKELEQKKQEQAKAALRQGLDKLVATQLADHPIERGKFQESMVATGDPVTIILEHADRLQADLIIIGTHSKGAVAHALLGSVAERVLHKSKIPVLAVPLPAA